MNRGKLIIFEGINGSGKSHYSKIIRDEPNTVYFKFPDRYSTTGRKIDKFLKKEINLPLEESIQLFIDNIFESKNNIKNKLNQGINVICDRYVISTMTYNYTEIINQIYNKNKINSNTILTLIKKINGLIKPDIIFLINGDHIDKREESAQRYHKNETMNMLIFNNYITTLSLLKEKWILIDNVDLSKTKENIKLILTTINLINNNSIQYYF